MVKLSDRLAALKADVSEFIGDDCISINPQWADGELEQCIEAALALETDLADPPASTDGKTLVDKIANYLLDTGTIGNGNVAVSIARGIHQMITSTEARKQAKETRDER